MHFKLFPIKLFAESLSFIVTKLQFMHLLVRYFTDHAERFMSTMRLLHPLERDRGREREREDKD